MNDNQFELLPNEIFIEIFQYFNAQELFRAFYNLNSRFNILLQSINNLYLFLTTSDYCYDYITPYIDILFIYGKIQINLNNFPKIRRLFLLQLTNELLEQLRINHLPYLEQIFIRSENQLEENLWNKIFSNGFPYLKSCCIHRMGLLTINSSWTQILSLRILKIGDIDGFIYKSILLSCPNLYFFKFTRLISTNKSTNIFQHINLKKLIIVIPWFEEFSEGFDMNYYFSYVPNLEQFTIHRTNESKIINESFLKFDWYASLINLYLPLLSHFTYYFHILKSYQTNNFTTEVILNQIQERFNHIHHHLYQYRLIIDLIG